MPKTSELKNKKIDFVEEDIDLSTIPYFYLFIILWTSYTDKAREESRLIREEKEKKERELKAQQAKENAQAVYLFSFSFIDIEIKETNSKRRGSCQESS